jgi:uncharacterized SAM-binding protein YcdF (DUF218 family)
MTQDGGNIEAKGRIAKRIAITVGIVLVAYVAGFVQFALGFESADRYPEKRTDAIIVLTGEGVRITEGVRELAKGLSDKLFISGVYDGAPISRVIEAAIGRLRAAKYPPRVPLDTLRQRIYSPTGKAAANTLENAMESAKWIKSNDVKSVRLMTSFYHLPRAELVFRKYMPGLVIVPHPVLIPGEAPSAFKSRRVFALALSEYNKYMATYIWDKAGIDFSVLARIARQGK